MGRTKVSSVEDLQQLFIETLIDKTDKVTKISSESILVGIGFGVAKIAQKAVKDIALIESELFPDFGYGKGLDEISQKMGISPRYGVSQSSTYLLLVGDEGTTYQQGVHRFSGRDGLIFDLTEDITIGEIGYTYAKVRSKDLGIKTNVDPLTINEVNPSPVGHNYLINEFAAIGGRDREDDNLFRNRIKESPNIFAQKTLSFLDQALNKINNNVLKTYFQGSGNTGKIKIGVLAQNGISFTSTELDGLLDKIGDNLALTDQKDFNNSLYGIEFVNIEFQPIDISFRILFDNSYNPDEVRKKIQIKMAKKIDYRFWKDSDIIEWDDLLEIVKSVEGIKYVSDKDFFPNSDISIQNNLLPRIRGFRMMDLDGNIISDIQGVLNPVFYPVEADFSFQSTVLAEIPA